MEKKEKMNRFEQHARYKNKLALFVTLAAIALPMISFEERHLLLFNFYHNRFEILFFAFEVNTPLLASIFVVFAVCVILVFNFTYARYFCGHLCPKTILKNLFTEVIEGKLFKILKQKNIQNETIDKKPLQTFFAYITLEVVTLAAPLPFFFYFIPYDIFMQSVLNAFVDAPLLGMFYGAISLYLFAEILFFKEFFCSYLCPYQLVHAITYNEEKSYYAFSDKEACIACDMCVRVCPIPDLDIKKGYDPRCIACGDCSAVCADMVEAKRSTPLLVYTDAKGVKNRSRFFSFAGKKKVLLLVAATLILGIGAIATLASQKNLTSCRFVNESLH
ncbi:MAG: 4Fe-4S binding protein [Thiovulaceae bacterium]|nr:4Fe-4S binding protein [Sulfurimonadaceae bacterium]